MKVLFAVSKEDISDSIIKKYQKEYKEIISYKNVYYFNAIIKELQKDKTYDRIVIFEELEEFAQTQYDQIDKFIFDKLDSITDEASNLKGDDIPIILVCSDRRQKSEEMLIKLFGIGIYNAILGNDRSIDNVCSLLNKPRTKKEAKNYYKIDSDDVSYQSENENDVSEMEMQNILAHYKRLGKDEKRYVESFNNIASQYNDTQLRIISKYLPLNVRAVLEEQSPKYQQIMSFNNKVSDVLRSKKQENKADSGTSEKLLNVQDKPKLSTSPIVIPSSVNLSSTKKMGRIRNIEEDIIDEVEDIEETETIVESLNKNATSLLDEIEKNEEIEEVIETPKRGRGRPRKVVDPSEAVIEKPKRGRGRPKKEQSAEDTTILPGLEESDDDLILPGILETEKEENILPGFEEKTEYNELLQVFEDNDEEEEAAVLPGFEDINEEPIQEENIQPQKTVTNIFHVKPGETITNITQFLTADKKIASFVGTSKNGTSFIVNNLAEICSQKGIDTAILDVTKNRNSYYIYTKNEESLRKIAENTPSDLIYGTAEGIKVNKNLTVYTSLPADYEQLNNAGKILETLVKKHSLVLIDTDFETPIEYFEKTQEIYLVQSYDILTIQPLTEFLKNLKYKNIINDQKLKIVLNKTVRNKNFGSKKMEELIIGGMSKYNDPNMTIMTDLFNEKTIKYIAIPFNQDVYSRYLEGIIDCDISIKNYPKDFMQIFNELQNMVYPLVSGKSNYRPPTIQNNGFTPSMNSALDQMRKNY